jgi:asparagine synthase (glutamine-hydrolysing)
VPYTDASAAHAPFVTDMPQALHGIRTHLIEAVCKRLNADVPVGFLLSGGLDSSLVCAIAARALNKPLITFATGLTENPIDIKYARRVAQHIGSEHHEVLFTMDEVFAVLDTLIALLETWDITTIRASLGMYLVCRYVRQKTDVRVLLTGEVSDELFGYKYTDFAPSPDAFQSEAQKRVHELYQYDVLRADRCIAANSLEARVPFSDRDFVACVMRIDPRLKMNTRGMGKYVLRAAFAEGDWLPQEILWREKAAFSDAVGHSLVDQLKAHAESLYSDAEFAQRAARYSHTKPISKEALWYREIFEQHYPGRAAWIKDYWLPNQTWTNCQVSDPSARVLPNYGASGH